MNDSAQVLHLRLPGIKAPAQATQEELFICDEVTHAKIIASKVTAWLGGLLLKCSDPIRSNHISCDVCKMENELEA